MVLRQHPDFRSREFLLEHVASTMRFYHPHCIDPNGGFFHFFRDDGDIYDRHTRHLVSSTRFVFNYSMAYQAFGGDEYRAAVAHGIRFLRDAHRDPATGERLFMLATGVMAVAFVVACSGLPAPVVMCGALVAGLADGVAEIAYTSRLQALPEQRRARLFGLSTTVETSGFAFGMVAAGAALDVFPALAVVAMFHGLALCAAAMFLMFGHRGKEEDDSHAEARAVHRT